jgi:integrase
MLTNAAVKAARSQSRAYKMFDERGLYLFIAPSGLRAWRLKYRFEGREKLLSIGRWPELQLADARVRADEARALLAQGEDPAIAAKTPAAIVTFESVARDWHALQVEHWTDRHAADVLASLARDILPEFGAEPIEGISTPMVLRALRLVEARGAIETARRLRQRISAVFAFGISEGLVDKDPAAIIARALKPKGREGRQPALLDLDQARALLAAADRAGGPPTVRLASRFLALTAVRMGGLLGARWDEMEDIDGAAPLWRIPAARMKIKMAKKGDPTFDHLVPLAPAAVAILRAVRENGYDTHSGLVFPMTAAAIGALYARAGYAGRHVPHGWRATFSTILNERFPEERATIDRALAHVPKDKVEAAYNRAQQLERRRRLYGRWADLLNT